MSQTARKSLEGYTFTMPRTVRCGLIQASNAKSPAEASLAQVKDAMIEKHLKLIDEAAQKQVQILCLL
jgi:N-carbamoylputrescine amidase